MMDLTEALICGAIEALGGGFVSAPGARRPSTSRRPGRGGPMPSCWPSTPASTRPIRPPSRPAPRPPGIATAGKDPDVVISELFEAVVEDRLDGPMFVIDYPAAICPLTKRKASNPAVAERFELYIQRHGAGQRLHRAERPDLQEELFRKQLAGLPEEESMAKMDEDFVRALKHGMPPAGGLGIGIDRLCMILLNRHAAIRDVILFPLMRPQAARMTVA